jgi:hypothetical protein
MRLQNVVFWWRLSFVYRSEGCFEMVKQAERALSSIRESLCSNEFILRCHVYFELPYLCRGFADRGSGAAPAAFGVEQR